MSKTQFRYKDLNILGKLFVRLFKMLHLIRWEESTADGIITTNNFTLINFMLLILGPTHEQQLTNVLVGIQIACTVLAFVVRYPLAIYFYESK